jgi:hypothetical protein
MSEEQNSAGGADSTIQELARKLRLGATGKFPDGKICTGDEGGLRAAMAADPKTGHIMLLFGKPIEFLAMTPDEAIGLAEGARRKALELRPNPRERVIDLLGMLLACPTPVFLQTMDEPHQALGEIKKLLGLGPCFSNEDAADALRAVLAGLLVPSSS